MLKSAVPLALAGALLLPAVAAAEPVTLQCEMSGVGKMEGRFGQITFDKATMTASGQFQFFGVNFEGTSMHTRDRWLPDSEKQFRTFYEWTVSKDSLGGAGKYLGDLRFQLYPMAHGWLLSTYSTRESFPSYDCR